MSSFRFVRLVLAVVALAMMATPTLAADPQPQAPVDPPSVAAPAVVPNVDINQAELQAGVTFAAPVDGATVAPAPAERPLSPMMIEIEAALAASDAAVAALAQQATQVSDEASKQAIMVQIAEQKQAAEFTILGIQANHARSRGDEALAARIEADIALIKNPPAPVAQTATRPLPADGR